MSSTTTGAPVYEAGIQEPGVPGPETTIRVEVTGQGANKPPVDAEFLSFVQAVAASWGWTAVTPTRTQTATTSTDLPAA